MTDMNRGARIKHARESRGYSQTEFARLMGIPQAAVSRMENMELVDEAIVAQVAQILNYPTSYFDKPSVAVCQNSTMLYRKRASVKVKDMMMFGNKVDDVAIAIDALLDSIDIPELDIPAISPTDTLSPFDIAYRIRRLLGLDLEPVARIVHLLEKHGVVVYFFHLDSDASEKIDGLTIRTPKGYPVIFVNGNFPNDRIRFTLAHELGHLVMHLRNGEEGADPELQELQANNFAAEFLMPRDRCGADFYDLKVRDLPFLKRKWLVSKHAIIHRAAELGCITDKTASYLYITLGRNGESKKETVWVDCDRPVMVQKMVALHRNALNYSDEELSRILGLYPAQIVDALPDSPKLKLSL